MILSCLNRIFLPSRNQIFLDSFYYPRECYLLSSPYAQHIVVNNYEDKEVLELSHQLYAGVWTSLVVVLLHYLENMNNKLEHVG
ncbi:hypothetical protein PR202_ga29732 [Eleusine coracana subsp. coracana]|uniref:Uncharacterized protein n=1 Tax=Eleusine coracana subsp. coracana TaxID=191504 RepID=A0AAV5DKR4_ELECO|nr:hypothetical protein PR202_ga29732 [Eleusine coracana subsp. coracana]